MSLASLGGEGLCAEWRHRCSTPWLRPSISGRRSVTDLEDAELLTAAEHERLAELGGWTLNVHEGWDKLARAIDGAANGDDPLEVGFSDDVAWAVTRTALQTREFARHILRNVETVLDNVDAVVTSLELETAPA